MTMPSSADQHGRGHERAAEADIRGQHDREIGSDGVERAVRQIDDAAERKDQRQPERDQKVDRAEEQAVDHLLRDENELHDGPPCRETSRISPSG